jgi:hypothetical protein
LIVVEAADEEVAVVTMNVGHTQVVVVVVDRRMTIAQTTHHAPSRLQQRLTPPRLLNMTLMQYPMSHLVRLLTAVLIVEEEQVAVLALLGTNIVMILVPTYRHKRRTNRIDAPSRSFCFVSTPKRTFVRRDVHLYSVADVVARRV